MAEVYEPSLKELDEMIAAGEAAKKKKPEAGMWAPDTGPAASLERVFPSIASQGMTINPLELATRGIGFATELTDWAQGGEAPSMKDIKYRGRQMDRSIRERLFPGYGGRTNALEIALLIQKDSPTLTMAEAMELAQGYLKQQRLEYPDETLAGEMAGGTALGAVTGGTSATSTIPARIIAQAGESGVSGGGVEYGRTGNIESSLERAKEDVIWGAGGGVVGEVGAKFGPSVLNRARRIFSPTARKTKRDDQLAYELFDPKGTIPKAVGREETNVGVVAAAADDTIMNPRGTPLSDLEVLPGTAKTVGTPYKGAEEAIFKESRFAVNLGPYRAEAAERLSKRDPMTRTLLDSNLKPDEITPAARKAAAKAARAEASVGYTAALEDNVDIRTGSQYRTTQKQLLATLDEAMGDAMTSGVADLKNTLRGYIKSGAPGVKVAGKKRQIYDASSVNSVRASVDELFDDAAKSLTPIQKDRRTKLTAFKDALNDDLDNIAGFRAASDEYIPIYNKEADLDIGSTWARSTGGKNLEDLSFIDEYLADLSPARRLSVQQGYADTLYNEKFQTPEKAYKWLTNNFDNKDSRQYKLVKSLYGADIADDLLEGTAQISKRFTSDTAFSKFVKARAKEMGGEPGMRAKAIEYIIYGRPFFSKFGAGSTQALGRGQTAAKQIPSYAGNRLLDSLRAKTGTKEFDELIFAGRRAEVPKSTILPSILGSGLTTGATSLMNMPDTGPTKKELARQRDAMTLLNL